MAVPLNNIYFQSLEVNGIMLIHTERNNYISGKNNTCLISQRDLAGFFVSVAQWNADDTDKHRFPP
jgi:hypothetical protein